MSAPRAIYSDVDPLPQGELPEDELTEGDTLQALYAAIDGIKPMRTQTLAVRDIEAHSGARGVVLSFSWKVGRTKHHVSVRLSRAQGRSLVARLGKALE